MESQHSHQTAFIPPANIQDSYAALRFLREWHPSKPLQHLLIAIKVLQKHASDEQWEQAEQLLHERLILPRKPMPARKQSMQCTPVAFAPNRDAVMRCSAHRNKYSREDGFAIYLAQYGWQQLPFDF
jgi:hypothetical protein